MGKTNKHVALIVGPNSEMEAQAIRSALEYFQIRVTTYWIGRPRDLIEVLTGEGLMSETDCLILSFHGEEGELLMPVLEESVYELDEPRGNFGSEEIKVFGNLADRLVIGNGCTLGRPDLAKAFLAQGCRAYIGPGDYIDGNAALYFIIRFFYELISNGKSEKEAYDLAKSTDNETWLYEWYSSEKVLGFSK
ncbi:delta-aminolevulinic acid dehydratase [Bacillus haimaensis]|uniref:delta-aminolevulinic acid dehydratase n=1 Tax=Bacillus haimaensis TaxID=3160967 RepID=UPI003AA82A6A